MNDKTLVERIRNRIHDAPMPTEHLLDEAATRIEAQATRIEALEAALRDIKNAVRIGPVTDIVAWQRLGIACQAIATKALEGE